MIAGAGSPLFRKLSAEEGNAIVASAPHRKKNILQIVPFCSIFIADLIIFNVDIKGGFPK
jgi:hypothetical protein